MFRPVLQINADYSPMKILTWERGVEMLMDNKVIAVENYAGAFVRSESLALPWPAVVSLRRFRVVRGRVRFSARNVQARDAFTCSYCGVRPRLRDGRPDREALTLDHVIPRAQSKHGTVYLPWSKRWVNVTCWENSATACRSCNMFKADRSPQQAGLTLRIMPRVPTQSDVLRMTLLRVKNVPEEWHNYLPPGWRATLGLEEEGELNEALLEDAEES